MTEDVFLSTIQEKPNDDTTRLIYSDWLTEQEDEGSAAKAAFIRADCELAALLEEDKRRKQLSKRRRMLAQKLDSEWLAVVSKLPLEKCSFAYECPLKWENLQAVEGSSTVRFCDKCAKNVFYSDSIDEAQSHARRGHCVAVAAALTRTKDDLDPPFHQMTMGILLPPSERRLERSEED